MTYSVTHAGQPVAPGDEIRDADGRAWRFLYLTRDGRLFVTPQGGQTCERHPDGFPALRLEEA